MARPFRITQIHLEGTDVPHAWHLPAGVTVIVGAIGGGKTSLLNLIKYGLGGDAPITAEIKGVATGVRLGLEFDARRVEVTRDFGRNTVEVDEAGVPRRTFGVNNGMSDPWLSGFLLQALGIPRVRVPKSRTQRSHDLVALSFQDVLTFCYLDQDQVDRSTMHDTDSFRGPKRFWVFELLHGIIDDTVTELVEKREELRADVAHRSKRAVTVEEFARDKHLRSEAVIVQRLAQIQAEEDEIARLLIIARADAAAAAEAAAAVRATAAASEASLALANTEHRRLRLSTRASVEPPTSFSAISIRRSKEKRHAKRSKHSRSLFAPAANNAFQTAQPQQTIASSACRQTRFVGTMNLSP
jgi:hypothetical protein